MTIIWAVLVLGVLGLTFGIILAIASKVFEVEVDPKITMIREALPGANCGACGFPGCDGLAKAMTLGKIGANGCPVASSSAVEQISGILGVSAELGERKTAKILCKGCNDKAVTKYEYSGIPDCKAAVLVQGGNKLCNQGCLGLGTCAKSCAFGAINMSNGVAIINKDKCTGCGKCVTECPKNVIAIVPYDQEVIVECKNVDFGKAAKEVCKASCIGCKMCQKNCPFDAISIENNLAVIDYSKCKQCLVCTAKCPTKAISGDLTKRVKAKIIEDLCIGCGICKKKCPVEAIEGEMKQKHIVLEDKCIGCKECVAKCPKKAIETY